jgi:hypothetical protein
MVKELLAQPPPQNWRTAPCWPSVTAFSIHSQLTSISGDRLLHLKPENGPCHGDRDPNNAVILVIPNRKPGQEEVGFVFSPSQLKLYVCWYSVVKLRTNRWTNKEKTREHVLNSGSRLGTRNHKFKCAYIYNPMLNGALSQRHGSSSVCGWRRQTQDIEDS